MAIEKSPSYLATQLHKACDIIKHIEEDYKNQGEERLVGEHIQRLLPVLQECNELLKDKMIKRGVESKTVNELLQTLQIFPFSRIQYDQLTQARVNAIQANLFARFITQLDTLESFLRNWRAEQKRIKGTSKSGAS